MNKALIEDLRQFAVDPRVSIVDECERIQISIIKAEVSVVLVIPTTVLELSIEVNDARSNRKITDWLDYAGYEPTPIDLLAEDMRVDVVQFVGRLLARQLRFAGGGRILEWEAGDRWLQAVPFVPDV